MGCRTDTSLDRLAREVRSVLDRLRRRRVEPWPPSGWGSGWDGPPEAGVREPRRPAPFAGAGMIALAVPKGDGAG